MDCTVDGFDIEHLNNSLSNYNAAHLERGDVTKIMDCTNSHSHRMETHSGLESAGTSLQTACHSMGDLRSPVWLHEEQQNCPDFPLETDPNVAAAKEFQPQAGSSSQISRDLSRQCLGSSLISSNGENTASFAGVRREQLKSIIHEGSRHCRSSFIGEMDSAVQEQLKVDANNTSIHNRQERKAKELMDHPESQGQPAESMGANVEIKKKQDYYSIGQLMSQNCIQKTSLVTSDISDLSTSTSRNEDSSTIPIVFLPQSNYSSLLRNSIAIEDSTLKVSLSPDVAKLVSEQVTSEVKTSLSSPSNLKRKEGMEESDVCIQEVKLEVEKLEVEEEKNSSLLNVTSKSLWSNEVLDGERLDSPDRPKKLSITLRRNRQATWKMKEMQDDDFPEKATKRTVKQKRRFPCEFCDRKCRSLETLRKHLASHKKRNASLASEKNLIVTGSKDSPIADNYLELSPLRFICAVCNSSFTSKRELTTHVLGHVQSRPYPSSECGERFRNQVNLKGHQEEHKKTETFSCPKCSFTTNRQRTLKRHLQGHSNIRQFECQDCDFTAKRRFSLLRHIERLHTPVSVYKCTVCTHKFTSLDSFKVHVAMHAAMKSILCLICGVKMPRRPNLIEHLLSHSCDPEVSCHVCKETFTANHLYLLHLLKHKENGPALRPKAKRPRLSEYDIVDDFGMENGHNETSVASSNSRVSRNIVRNRVMTDVSIESNMSMLTVLSEKIMALSRVVSFTNEKHKIVSQLSQLSDVSTRLYTISKRMLHSYKLTHGLSMKDVKAKLNSEVHSIENGFDAVSDGEDMESAAFEGVSGDLEDEDASHRPVKKESEDANMDTAAASATVRFNGKSEMLTTGDFPSESEMKPLKCRRCDLIFTDTRSLKRHIQAHDDYRPFGCDKCGKSFRRNEHLMKHMVTHSQDRPYVCSECPYKAKTASRLRIHKMSHSAAKAFSCDICSYKARTRYELNHHMKRHEKRECPQCGFICFSRLELKRHVFTHSQYDCNECNFSTKDRTLFTKHMKKHQSVEYFCELCGYSCNTLNKFRYHKLRHENKTPFQCPDCDYKCSSRASYDCHRLKHAGLKPYLCSFCGSSFRKSSHLNQHMLIHKDEKSFKCSHCEYACRTKHNLKEHEMTHSGEKPFTCKYCSFSTRRNKALQLHMAKHRQVVLIPPLQEMGVA